MNRHLSLTAVLTSAFLIYFTALSYDKEFNIIYLTVFIGSLTSVLNHATTNQVAKYADRAAMLIATCVFLSFSLNSPFRLVLVFFMICMYLSSKRSDKRDTAEFLHMITHGSVIILFTDLTFFDAMK